MVLSCVYMCYADLRCVTVVHTITDMNEKVCKHDNTWWNEYGNISEKSKIAVNSHHNKSGKTILWTLVIAWDLNSQSGTSSNNNHKPLRIEFGPILGWYISHSTTLDSYEVRSLHCQWPSKHLHYNTFDSSPGTHSHPDVMQKPFLVWLLLHPLQLSCHHL